MKDNQILVEGRFSLSQLMFSLRRLGLVLNRAHRKANDGLGTTTQLMLIFERGKSELPEEQYRGLVEPFIGIGVDHPGYSWQVTARFHQAIARVPDHVLLHCGNPELKEKGVSLTMRERELKEAVGETGMVRMALNIYPHTTHLIPKWVEERARHGQKERIRNLTERLRSA